MNHRGRCSFLAVAVVFCGLPLTAAIVSQTTTCTTNVGTVTTQTGCSLAGVGTSRNGWATATGIADSLSVSGTSLTLSASASATVSASFDLAGNGTAGMQSSANVIGSDVFQFATVGPVRAGYLLISTLVQVSEGELTFSLAGNAITYVDCVSGAGRACGYSNLWVPITLGTTQSFSGTFNLSALDGGVSTPDPLNPASGKISATIQFFEGDQDSPVALLTAPEPTAWLFGATGLSTVAGIRRRSRIR